jgi:pimeloyl-ACP methyl ester carboxylesterase
VAGPVLCRRLAAILLVVSEGEPVPIPVTFYPLAFVFTPWHRGGSGPPLVCLHGFAGTWRVWELVLPALERRHDVLAPSLTGHAGGPPLPDALTDETLPDAIERAMDEAGFARAHLVGNSLGGFLALQLAARGRASSVVALAPAGGWAEQDPSVASLLDSFVALREQMRALAPYADAIARTPDGRRRATQLITTHSEHIPPDLVAHLICGVAEASAVPRLVAHAHQSAWKLAAHRIDCPVRIVWGTRRPVAAVAVERGALPARMAATGGLGAARRHRPLPAARRPARDRAADPRDYHAGQLARFVTAPVS